MASALKITRNPSLTHCATFRQSIAHFTVQKYLLPTDATLRYLEISVNNICVQSEKVAYRQGCIHVRATKESVAF